MAAGQLDRFRRSNSFRFKATHRPCRCRGWVYKTPTADTRAAKPGGRLTYARLLDEASKTSSVLSVRKHNCASEAILPVSINRRIAVKDFTKGSIVNHILTMATPVAVGMMAQIAYQLIDLYFVTRIGVAATAGVNAAGNVAFIVGALTQVLGIGTGALVAHAVGRQDQTDANVLFNQSMTLSLACAVITMALVYLTIRPYLRSVAADTATINAGTAFILWVLPGYAVMLPMTVLSFALRGCGVVRPTIAFYMLTVIVNAILAPILIAGGGTGVALGVKGAGLATSISVAVGFVVFATYFQRSQRYMTIQGRLMRPQLKQWGRVLTVGLPAGGDIALYFFYTAVVYYAIRNFGAAAQAGFGIGARVLQTILLPGVSIALSVGPIVGQNFGAKNCERVKETFRKTLLMGTAAMMATIVLVQWRPYALVNMFGADAEAIAIAAVFLQLTSWSLVAQGLVTTCSSMFQGLGNTVPSLISSFTRLFAFAVPAVWLSTEPAFRIEHVWYLSVASLMLQAIVSLWLLRVEFRRRLPSTTVSAAPLAPPTFF
jgi:putative MATE family efflux protein